MMRWLPAVTVLAVVLGGCGLFGSDKPERLPGERIPVLLYDTKLVPDPRIADLAVRLPPPVKNKDWPQPGGYPNHAMQHLAIAEVPRVAWRASIGQGSTDELRLLTAPVVAAGRVFAMDAESFVSAYDAETGRRLWRVRAVDEEEEGGELGGGVAYDDGRLFVTTGAAQVRAYNADTGAELWSTNLTAPMRGGPTVAAGRVFAITVDNQAHALDARDGRKLWSNSGIIESAGLLGGPSPAVGAEVVVVPYSSGELLALRIENGRVIWSDNLITIQRVDAVSSLADIRGQPVLDRGWVIAVSHSGRLAAIDVRSGVRVWDKNIGGVETPWVAGDFVFMLTNEGELLALSRRDGRIRWIQPLPRFEDEEAKEGPIFWTGPVLASDRLIVAGSNAELLSVSPYDGAIMGRVELSDSVRVPPIVADGTLYILTEDADLIAFR